MNVCICTYVCLMINSNIAQIALYIKSIRDNNLFWKDNKQSNPNITIVPK